jgi:hypothetical protein
MTTRLKLLLKNSGCLELRKIDVECNPWHYKLKVFLKHYNNPKQRKEAGSFFATKEIKTSEGLYKTFRRNGIWLSSLYSKVFRNSNNPLQKTNLTKQNTCVYWKIGL